MRDYESVRLCAGRGKYFSLTKPDSNSHLETYPTTSWRDILWMAANPNENDELLKDYGWWVIASDLIDRTARQARPQEQSGQFWLGIGDIDKGNLPLATVVDGLGKVLDAGTEYLIYSTKSSEAENKRWRIMFPLGQPCPGAYHKHFADLFNKALTMQLGIELDACTDKAQQIAFLPNRGNYYEYLHQQGAAFGHTNDVTLARQLIEASVEATLASPTGKRNLVRNKERGYYLTEFSKRYPVEQLLHRYGFESNNRGAWNHPKIQSSGNHSTDVTDDGTWLSSSPSVQSFIGRSGGDSFDLYTAFECGGDRDKAYRNICSALSFGIEPSAEPPLIERGEYLTCNGVMIKLGVVQ